MAPPRRTAVAVELSTPFAPLIGEKPWTQAAAAKLAEVAACLLPDEPEYGIFSGPHTLPRFSHMTGSDSLSERERRVLETVVEAYIETAEPAGSQAIAKRSGLGVSPATIRSTMSELEEKGYLFHPHTSAGRVPTDRGYRSYVAGLRLSSPNQHDRDVLATELREPTTGASSAVEELLRRAAQVLGVLTQELGVAVAPALDQLVLERIELVPVSSERLLIVFNLRSGVVRTIYVQVPGSLSPQALQRASAVLNERLAGNTLRTLRSSLHERLRDAGADGQGQEILNIFIAEGDELFDLADAPGSVVLGSARLLADQPEFAGDSGRMKELLHLTEQRDLLAEELQRRSQRGLSITIGSENGDPRLRGFTLVTASYRAGELRGVIGVMGPTRMPYDKILNVVSHASRLVEGLLDE